MTGDGRAIDVDRLRATVADRYRVDREIGRGGMATVFLAGDLRHGRRVALKVLNPDVAASLGRDRFHREIEMAAGLQHPHILPLFSSDEIDGFLFYVMPYVDGESLGQRLAREKQLGLEETTSIVRQVAEALGYAHRKGVIHRDVKPDNILLSPNAAMLADFGIARAVTEAGGETLTRTGTIVGSPAYMSPEQAAGDEEPDARSDIYSLGCVAFECLTGEPPFSARTSRGILLRHIAEPAPRVSSFRRTMPEPVSDVVARALAKLPADRFETPEAFADALEASSYGAAEARFTNPISQAIDEIPRPVRRGAGALATLALTAYVVSLLGVFGGDGGPGGTAAQTDGAPLRMAVLPFENRIDDPTARYAPSLEGLHREMMSTLRQLDGFEVMSERSAEVMAGMVLREAADRNDIDLYVNAWSSLLADSLIVTLQLLDGPTEEQLWRQNYGIPADSSMLLAEFAEPIIQAIADERSIPLTRDDRIRLTAHERPDPAAVLLTQEAWYLGGDAMASRLERALPLLHEAIAIDPDYAQAWSALSTAYSSAPYTIGMSMPRAADSVRWAANRALDLDPQLGEPHANLGWMLFAADAEPEAALAEMKAGYELSPRQEKVVHDYGFGLALLGRYDEALEVVQQELRRDPYSYRLVNLEGKIHLMAGRIDQALSRFDDVLRLSPNFWNTVPIVALTYSLQGRHDEALETVRNLIDQHGEGWRENLAWTYAKAGEHEAARQIADEIRARIDDGGHGSEAYLASIYAMLDEWEIAFELLERAIETYDGSNVMLYAWPAYDPLREDPRFDDVLGRLGFPVDEG